MGGVQIGQAQSPGHLADERGLLADGVDAGHVEGGPHQRQQHAGQSAAAADVQHALRRGGVGKLVVEVAFEMTIKRRQHGQAVGDVLNPDRVALAHGGEVVRRIPADELVDVGGQPARLGLAQRQAEA